MLVHKRESNKYLELTIRKVVVIGGDQTKIIRWPLGVILGMFIVYSEKCLLNILRVAKNITSDGILKTSCHTNPLELLTFDKDTES